MEGPLDGLGVNRRIVIIVRVKRKRRVVKEVEDATCNTKFDGAFCLIKLMLLWRLIKWWLRLLRLIQNVVQA